MSSDVDQRIIPTIMGINRDREGSFEDRGRQRAMLGEQLGLKRPASNAEYYNYRVAAALASPIESLVEDSDIKTLETNDDFPIRAALNSQLASIQCLHSIQIPGDYDSLSKLAQRAKSLHQLHTREIDLGHTVIPRIVTNRLYKIFDTSVAVGEDPRHRFSKIIQSLRSSRNISLLENSTLNDLLLSAQTGLPISLMGLSSLLKDSAAIINADLESGKLQYSDRTLNELVLPVLLSLERHGEFVKKAEEARLPSDTESETAAQKRASILMDLFAELTQEHILVQGKEDAPEKIASLLIESFFTHRIQWVDNKDTVSKLCRLLISDGNSVIAEQVMLQAQRSRLIDRETIGRAGYEKAGLGKSVFTHHREELAHYSRHKTFYDNPYEPLQESHSPTGLLLMFGNVAHIGYRILATSSKNPVIVSLNHQKRLALDESRPFLFSYQDRIRWAENNLAGLSGRTTFLTSIDGVTDYTQPITKRISEYIATSGAPIFRVCGYDRKDLTPPDVDVQIGLRGQDLARLINSPLEMDRLREIVPSRKVTITILQGSSQISATRVIQNGIKWLQEGDRAAFDTFRSYLHPKNVNPILEAIQKQL